MKHEPDFTELLKVLEGKRPDRPVLFEFFFDDEVYERFAGRPIPRNAAWPNLEDLHTRGTIIIDAFKAAGYDHATVPASAFDVMHNVIQGKGPAETVSLNEGTHIFDEASFASFPWCEPEAFDDAHLKSLGAYLPDGMKLIINGQGGILEIVTQLTGYERLCYLLSDNPSLVEKLFEAVGSRFVRYYRRAVVHDSVGAVIYNDDWGFNTGPMIAPDDIRRLIFPHVREIVALAHRAGKPAILHSCGNLYSTLMEDIIEDLKFDAKHSFEDLILPVEKAYEVLQGRIAVLGGLDVDFLVRSTPAEIEERSRKLLDQTSERGGYALGSGNSIASYIPEESFRAVRRAAGAL